MRPGRLGMIDGSGLGTVSARRSYPNRCGDFGGAHSADSDWAATAQKNNTTTTATENKFQE